MRNHKYVQYEDEMHYTYTFILLQCRSACMEDDA